MKNAEAIETLRANYPDACFEQLREAVDAAIEALKAQLSQEGTTSDLISRQAEIDVLDKQIKQCCKALGSLSLSDADKHAVEVKMASLRAHREMLQNLPTVQPEPQWIPVSERLPEVGQTIIAQCRANIIKTLKLDSDGDWYQDAEHCYMSGFVVAWMPLPEPYKLNNK